LYGAGVGTFAARAPSSSDDLLFGDEDSVDMDSVGIFWPLGGDWPITKKSVGYEEDPDDRCGSCWTVCVALSGLDFFPARGAGGCMNACTSRPDPGEKWLELLMDGIVGPFLPRGLPPGSNQLLPPLPRFKLLPEFRVDRLLGGGKW